MHKVQRAWSNNTSPKGAPVGSVTSGRVVDPDGYIRINVKTGDASFVGDAEGFIDASNQKKK